jgi:hypothetical protein
MKQIRRISPRIPYDESVCLTRVDGGGRLFGRSVNLGSAGIYVKCAEPCEIGTELVCSVLLPGGPRKLRGRVTRLNAIARGVGIAVAFGPITAGDRAVIERLITDHQREVFQAKLRLDGIERPVDCEAVFDDRTLHLSTSLPFLGLDAGVGVVLGDHEELEAEGVISRIALDHRPGGAPRLALDVDLAGGASGDDGDEDDDSEPPPSALPALCGHPLPTVVISKTLVREAVARSVLAGRPRRRSRGTAEIPIRSRFTDWTAPPAVTPPSFDDRTQRIFLPRAPRRRIPRLAQRPHARPPAFRWGYLLLVLPVAAAVAALLAKAI